MNDDSLQHRPIPRARSLTVLLADDAAEVRNTLATWLEQQGHRVICVGSGSDGARVLRQTTIDLVITEVIMPNGDGLELMLEARKRQPQARTIAFSAGGRFLPADDCLRVARGLGAHATLYKPVEREQLLAEVARVTAAVEPRVGT